MNRCRRKLSAVVQTGVAIVVVCLLLPLPQALGWGSDGHRIVAEIAQARLTPSARAAVAELLGDGKSAADPAGADDDGPSLASVANWADSIRKDREETAPWHYVDIPYEMSRFDPVRDGRNGQNVIAKIEDFAKVLNDRNAPRQQRVEALKFLVHFIGDIHQPMHCVERNEDKGGNFRLVFFPGRRDAVNLHRVWDSEILKLVMDGQKPAAFAAALNAKITREQESAWTGAGGSGSTPATWANEGHDAAVQFAYAGIPTDGPPPKITEEYLAAAKPVVATQLSKAGVRLSSLLNRIFR